MASVQEIGGNNCIPAECDLADLSSIQKVGSELPSLLGTNLNIACLNAGLAHATGVTDMWHVPRIVWL